MKITREQLKAMIKECIVEVLTEGLGPQQRITETLRTGKSTQYAQPAKRQFDPRLDTPIARKAPAPSPVSNAAIKAVAGKNSVMQSIFADTAATTLVEQVAAGDSSSTGESSSRASQTSVEHINGTPEEVFGEDTTSRWANLAFMPAKKTA